MHFSDYCVLSASVDTHPRRSAAEYLRPSTVTFSHDWLFEVAQLQQPKSTLFGIHYGWGANNWRAEVVDRLVSRRPVRVVSNWLGGWGQAGAPRELVLTVNPTGSYFGRAQILPTPRSATIVLSAYMDETLEEFLGTLTVKLESTNSSYWSRAMRDAQRVELLELLEQGVYVLARIWMEYDQSSFRMPGNRSGVSSVIRGLSQPERRPAAVDANDFRFAYAKTGDYTIHCSDGDVRAQRIVLYHRSPYFRRLLRPAGQQPFPTEHFLYYPKKLVDALIAYVHSDTFAVPSDFRVGDLPQLADLVDLLELPGSLGIRRHISEFVYDKVHKNLKNPHLLVRCLVAAYRSSLDDLVLPLCIANVHYGTFAECYQDEAGDPERRQLFAALNTGSFRNTLIELAGSGVDDLGQWIPVRYMNQLQESCRSFRVMHE